MKKLEFYRHYANKEELENVKRLLNRHMIPYEVSTPDTLLDSSIVGDKLFAAYTLKLLPTDFEEVNGILRKEAEDIDLNDFNHLDALSIDELKEILLNSDEWSVESEAAAKKILRLRGVVFLDKEIAALKASKELALSQGKSVAIGIQFAYFIAIIVGCFFGVIFIIAGVAMGFYYAFGKKVNKYGQREYIYDKKARNIGFLIVLFGIPSLIFTSYMILNYIHD